MKHTVVSTRRSSSRRLPQRLARLASAASLAIAGLSSGFAAHAQSASTIEGIFTNAKNAPDWTISGSRYGSARLPTMDGSGWLLLAGGNSAILGQVEANAKLASGVPIRVEFDYLVWGGAFDGLTLYFADARAASAGKNSEVGGGLGYCGMSGAYLGIGIDDGGNFAQTHCGIGHFSAPGALQGTAVTGPGVRANSVTVRGPASGQYPHLTSVSMNDLQDICVTCTDRNLAMKALRHVVLVMEPRPAVGSGYTLSMTVNGREILKNVDYPHAPPKELLMGLASTTGAYGANHEIRNLKLSVRGGITPTHCLNGVGPDGKCLPVVNGMKDWEIGLNVGAFHSGGTTNELIDGDLVQKGWDGKSAWSDMTPNLPADCMQVGPVSRTGMGSRVNQIAVVSRQDDWQNAVEPTPDMKFTKHGAVNIEVQYFLQGGSDWITPANATVTGNDKVIWTVDLPKTEMISNVSVVICKTADGKSSPVTEILAWEKK